MNIGQIQKLAEAATAPADGSEPTYTVYCNGTPVVLQGARRSDEMGSFKTFTSHGSKVVIPGK